MKVDRITIAGALMAIFGISLFAAIMTQEAFPAFEYASSQEHFINVTQDVGQQTSSFMWTNIGMDLIAQAFAIFAAAAACLAMLRVEEEDRE